MDGEWPPKLLAVFNALGVAAFGAAVIVAVLVMAGVIQPGGAR